MQNYIFLLKTNALRRKRKKKKKYFKYVHKKYIICSLDDVLYPYLWRVIAIIYIYINNQSNNNRMIKKDREKVGNEKFSISINFLSTVEETDKRSSPLPDRLEGKNSYGNKKRSRRNVSFRSGVSGTHVRETQSLRAARMSFLVETDGGQ